jgi:hypothetical protein
MTTDRVNMRETDEGSEAPPETTPFARELATRSATELRTPEEITPSTAAILNNGFGLTDAGSDQPHRAGRPTADSSLRAGSDSPNEPPAPTRDGGDRQTKLGDTLKQLLGDLMKGPLGDLLREVGRQLVSGQFDFDRLQNMVKNIHLDEQQVNQITQNVNKFTEALRNKTGVDVRVNFRNRPGGQVGVRSIQIADAGGRQTTVDIPDEGTPAGSEQLAAGSSDPAASDTTIAMTPAAAAARIRNSALERHA